MYPSPPKINNSMLLAKSMWLWLPMAILVALWAPQMPKSLFICLFFTDRADVRGQNSAKNSVFSPSRCSRCLISSYYIMDKLNRLSVAIVGNVAELGEMGVFCLENTKSKIWLLGFSVTAQTYGHPECTRGHLGQITPCCSQNRCGCGCPWPSW